MDIQFSFNLFCCSSFCSLLAQKKDEHYANVAVGKRPTKKQSIHLWHERLAHQNLARVKRFLRRNDIQYIDEDNFQCEHCIYGKIHRLPFPERRVKSLGGAQYFLLLKDDYSHYRFVYFLRHKSEVPQKITAFVEFVLTQMSRKINVIRSDNGTEYVNAELTNYFERKGIQHQRTVPYTPEQNGSSEREN